MPQNSNELLKYQANNCLEKNKQLLCGLINIFAMATTKKIIAGNVKTLMDHFEKTSGKKITQTEFGKMVGLSQRAVGYLFDDDQVASIRSDTIDKLAQYFGLKAFHLMIPDQPIEELLSKRIEKVVDCYIQSPLDGRENIQRISENEVRYNYENKLVANGE